MKKDSTVKHGDILANERGKLDSNSRAMQARLLGNLDSLYVERMERETQIQTQGPMTPFGTAMLPK